MRAVITVVGKDAVGIIAEVSGVLKRRGVNIVDITQSVMSDLFAMVMMADISACTVPFGALADELADLGRRLGLDVRAMHEDIFNSMHRI
ncbi:MAG: ACT domain-containing protein [Oscillospiraceae bacterium]|jgi:ACT domain-containing protein|nr:ACT domain-containing protein [Oscillospiraceae bacterium]